MKPIYDRVRAILQENELARNNDRFLAVKIWEQEDLDGEMMRGFGGRSVIDTISFVYNRARVSSMESITRARRKVQEKYPELRATSEDVKRLRGQKKETKGTFIYSDKWR